MALALVHSRARCGLQAPLVTVEVHLSRGLPRFQLVGLPETSVKAVSYTHLTLPTTPYV